MSRAFNPFGGFGTMPADDPAYQAGWVAFNRAQALSNFATLNVPNSPFANAFNNLRNSLTAVQEGSQTLDSQRSGIVGWTTQLNSYNAPGGGQTPADNVALVRHFYERYLHRTGAQVDQAGLDFWVGNVVRDGAAGRANVEQAFRVQAVNDGVYTNATLPAPEYIGASTSGGGGGGGGNAGGGGGSTGGSSDGGSGSTAGTSGGGLLDTVQETVGGIFDTIAEATGFSKGTVQAGAVVVVIGALVWFSQSDGKTTSRKR